MKLVIALNKYRYVVLLVASLFWNNDLQAQQEGKPQKESRSVEITVTVKDADGNILPETSVAVSEAYIITETNENGESSFKALPDDFVTITRPGYEKAVVLASELAYWDRTLRWRPPHS